ESLCDRVLPAGILAVGTDAGPVATVRTFVDSDANGTYDKLVDVLQPFGAAFKGGVRVAVGDFNGDGNDELVTAAGGGGGTVKIWTLNPDGSVGDVADPAFKPFGAFAGGLFVAAGDLDNDGRDELAVSQG